MKHLIKTFCLTGALVSLQPAIADEMVCEGQLEEVSVAGAGYHEFYKTSTDGTNDLYSLVTGTIVWGRFASGDCEIQYTGGGSWTVDQAVYAIAVDLDDADTTPASEWTEIATREYTANQLIAARASRATVVVKGGIEHDADHDGNLDEDPDDFTVDTDSDQTDDALGPYTVPTKGFYVVLPDYIEVQ